MGPVGVAVRRDQIVDEAAVRRPVLELVLAVGGELESELSGHRRDHETNVRRQEVYD